MPFTLCASADRAGMRFVAASYIMPLARLSTRSIFR